MQDDEDCCGDCYPETTLLIQRNDTDWHAERWHDNWVFECEELGMQVMAVSLVAGVAAIEELTTELMMELHAPVNTAGRHYVN